MSFVGQARTILERVSGFKVYRRPPHGTDIASDIDRVFPGYSAQTVFDVGANVGQSAQKFRTYFPDSEIFCFEPVAATYNELVRATLPLGKVRCFNLALGDEAGSQSMITTGKSLTFHLPREGEVVDQSASETVHVQRLDEFCAQQALSSINYLKIDAEGFDLRVLAGGERLIEKGAIDFIQVEAGMNPGYSAQVPFNELWSWLTSRGYDLFGIYAQCPTWPSGQIVRRADPVFIAKRMVKTR